MKTNSLAAVLIALLCLAQIASAGAVKEQILVEMPSVGMTFVPGREDVVFFLSFGNSPLGHFAKSMNFDLKQVAPGIYHIRNKSWKDMFWKIDANEKKVFRERGGSFGIKNGTETPIDAISSSLVDARNSNSPASPTTWVRMLFKQTVLAYEPESDKCRFTVDGDEVMSETEWEIKRAGVANYHFRARGSKGHELPSGEVVDLLPFLKIDTMNMKTLAVSGMFGSPDDNGRLLDWRVHKAGTDTAVMGKSSSPQNTTGWLQVEMNNMALKRQSSYKGVSGYQIVPQILSHDYQALEKWFESGLDRYKKEAQYETILQFWFGEFTDKRLSLADMDSWVKKTGSPIAYAARGVFKTPSGFIARRGKYVSGVSRKGLDALQQRYNDAAKDLETAISKNPSLMPAYTWLIKIAVASKMPFTPKQILQKALENDIRTYCVRYEYLVSLQPEKGGSLEEMFSFAKQESKYADVNPQIWTLQGEADAYQGEKLFLSDDHAGEIAAYTAALKFGDRILWLMQRAQSYESIGQKDKALADYEKVRYYTPYNASFFGKPDISAFNYEVKESTFVDPNMGRDQIQAYVVLPVEHHSNEWNKQFHEGEGLARRNIDKLELMILRLGYDCVERSKLDALLNEQKLSLTGLTNEKAQYVGQLINADAVVIAEIPALGVNRPLRTCYEDIDIKAVSVKSGKILWKSLLKGSVVSDTESIDYAVVLDTLETKIYEMLEAKLKNENVTTGR